MTDPLIDRARLIDVIADAPVDTLLADAVLTYLRSVLTPEALEMELIRTSACGADGADLHRRIFGENK
jgi:hypothetical protein